MLLFHEDTFLMTEMSVSANVREGSIKQNADSSVVQEEF